MKQAICKILLTALNYQWLNGSPANYGFVNNFDNFSRAYLEECKGMAVTDVLSDLGWEDLTMWDIHDLRTGGTH